MARLQLGGAETVLDAGCGTGRVTEMVLERLPRGRVIALDSSPAMVKMARARLPSDRTEVICADVLEFELAESVDAAVSTATFHWIFDHDALFARIRAALRDGGQFVAECGGEGNCKRYGTIANEVAAEPRYAEHLANMPEIGRFASVEQTRDRLAATGFAVQECWLEPRAMTPPSPREFLETVTASHYLERLPAELRDTFLDELLAALGDPLVLDFVRLNWDAVAI